MILSHQHISNPITNIPFHCLLILQNLKCSSLPTQKAPLGPYIYQPPCYITYNISPTEWQWCKHFYLPIIIISSDTRSVSSYSNCTRTVAWMKEDFSAVQDQPGVRRCSIPFPFMFCNQSLIFIYLYSGHKKKSPRGWAWQHSSHPSLWLQQYFSPVPSDLFQQAESTCY
jgi:hypothetical protein